MPGGSLREWPSASTGGVPWRLLAVAALAGLILRLAFGFGYWTGKPLTRDEQEYLSLARSLTAGNGFVYDEVMMSGPIDPFGRAPGYPAFLTLVGAGRTVVTEVPPSVKIAQSCLGAFGVLMVGLIAHRLAGPRAAASAATIAAIYPPLVWVAGYAFSEALFWPMGLLAAWLFDRALAQPARLMPAFACGLAIGAGTLVRSALVIAVPLAALLLIWRRQLPTLAALALGVVVVVAPWTARNYVHHGRLMFVASDGGVTFWTGNHPLATGEGDLAANPQLKLAHQRLRAQYPGISEQDLEPIYYREALAWITTHPLEWIALEFRKLFYLVVPIGPSYTLHSTRYMTLSIVSYAAVLALALVAVVRRVPLAATPGLWLLAASSVAVALAFFPQERFRIPILDPALVVLAGAAVATVGRRGRYS